MCSITCLTFILVCDNNMLCFSMFSHLFLCLVCAYSIVCFVEFVYDFNTLVAPFLFCLYYTCWLFFCMCHKSCSRIGFRAGSHPSTCTKPQDPLLGVLLVGTCFVHNSIQWIYKHNPYICYIWVYMSLCLFACFYFFVCLFVCFAYISLFGVLFVCVAYGGWSIFLLPRGKKKDINK